MFIMERNQGSVPSAEIHSQGGLTSASVNFLLCLHFWRISSLLFSISFGSPFVMTNFSVRQRSHWRPPEEKTWPLAFMDHFTSGANPLFFRYQMYEDSVVLFSFSFLNEQVCSLYLALNVRSVRP